MIFDKCAMAIKWRKYSLFNKWFWKNWISICKKMNFDPHIISYTKINQKGRLDQNVNLK